MHRVSEKWWHFYIFNNWVKNEPSLWFLECRISIIFYMKKCKFVHNSWKMSPHYLVECTRLSSDRNMTCIANKRWQYCNFLFRDAKFSVYSELRYAIHRKPCNQNISSMFPSASVMLKMSPLALDASTKKGAPLLHCSINDTLISRILHCQNVFPKLINVLDLTFVQVFNSFTRHSVYQSCYYYYRHHDG